MVVRASDLGSRTRTQGRNITVHHWSPRDISELTPNLPSHALKLVSNIQMIRIAPQYQAAITVYERESGDR
jgi:hypothetical protein